DRIQLLYQIVHDPVPPPRGVRGDLDPALEAVVLRAMARRPEERFAGAAEFAAALRGWLDGEEQPERGAMRVGPSATPAGPPAAPPPPTAPMPPPARWYRRHLAVAAGGGMILLAAVVAIGYSLWQFSVTPPEPTGLVAQKDNAAAPYQGMIDIRV